MKDTWRSVFLERAAAEAARTAQEAGMSVREAQALAREELRLLERVGGGERYHSMRAFLEALCSRTG